MLCRQGNVVPSPLEPMTLMVTVADLSKGLE
jgi:hypothetical protein